MKEMPVPLCVRYYRLAQDRSVLLVELTHLYTDRFSEELLMSELLGHGEDVRDRFHDYQLAMRDLESVDHKEAAEFWDKFSKEAEKYTLRKMIRCRMPLFYGSICPGKSVPARHRLCKEPRRLPGLRSECRNKGLAGTNKD